MKNREIIINAAVKAGMYTEEEADELLQKGEEIPLHTIQGWQRYGSYRVKDGEEGIEVKLWKHKEGESGKFYLAKARLYREEQLEPA